MHILTTLAPIDAPHGSAVALGFFDGVHLGHRAVLGAAVDYAAAHGLTAAAFTFSLPADHPLKGGRIFPDREKHRRVAELGSHEELMAKNGLYREIYDLQMTGEDRDLLFSEEGGESHGV